MGYGGAWSSFCTECICIRYNNKEIIVWEAINKWGDDVYHVKFLGAKFSDAVDYKK